MKISILMPVYNESAFIREAVESVAAQDTEMPFELIIVDDHSTDDTPRILAELSSEYPFVQCFKSPVKGKNNAFNHAFEKSAGDLIALFAGDDRLPPNSLKDRAAPLMRSLGRKAVSICKLMTFSQYRKFDGVITPRDPSKGSMIGGCIMMTRPMAEMCFPLPTVLANEDKWIVCHVNHIKEVEITHVPVVGIQYRIHKNNSSSRTDSFDRKNESMHARFIVYGRFLEHCREQLSSASIDTLSAQAAAETHRYKGDWISILFMRGLSLSDKARFIMHSNKIFYWVRIQLFSLLSGR